MAEVYFNQLGYYIVGDEIEIARSCPPLTRGGETVLTPIQHLYAVLISALHELVATGRLQDDVTVYNDSRLIEDMQGETPLDKTCSDSRQYLKRDLIPQVPSTVWFRKKSPDWVTGRVESGHKKMIGVVDVRQRDRKAQELVRLLERAQKEARRAKVDRFKRSWLDGPRDNANDAE